MNNLLEEIKEKIFSKYKKDSWEVKTLGEIATDIYIGSGITKDQLGTGDYPAIKCGDVNSKLPRSFAECVSFVDINLIKRPKYFEHGDILIGKIGDEESSGKSVVYMGKEKCLLGDAVYALKHNQNPEYLAFALSTANVRNQIKRFKKSGTVFNFFPGEIKQIKIPLPPLEIQNEIVEFLDKFTELEKELEKELEMRKEQYEYYKNLIFNRGINERNWEIKKLEDIAVEIYKGNDVHKVQIGTGDYPAITAANINGKGKISIEKAIYYINPDLIQRKKYCDYKDLLITNIGDKLTKVGNAVAYLSQDNCIVGENVYVVKHNQNPKYLSYALSTEFSRLQIQDSVYSGIVFVLSLKDMKKIQIPVPGLEEQAKVVEKLDLLYKIINDIREGIPLLIQKNREQYNVYKELLLEKK